MKRNALGRGLDSLISMDDIQTGGSSAITEIAIEQISPNPDQPRTTFDETALEELAVSIRELGIIQPLTLRSVGTNAYQIISGERRYRAAKLAGLRSVPAYVRTAGDTEVTEMALIENIQREDLNAIEIAVSYKRLLDECNLSQDELSAKVGKNKTTIVNYLRLLKLSKEVQIAVRDNKISMAHSRCIVGFDDFEVQNKMLNEILLNGLSVRQTEALAKRISGEVKPRKKVNVKLSDEINRFKSDLSKKLNARVAVAKDVTGKGKITIPFKSEEELSHLMSLLSK